MIEREDLIAPIRPFYKVMDMVKIITGLRRSGKSVLMDQVAEEIRKTTINVNIIKMNFELFEFAKIRTAEQLNEYIMANITKDKENYVFFDEIQNVKEFELVVNSLRARGNVSVFITGSNAHLLSSDLATNLAGRYVEFRITPLTFKESLELSNFKTTEQAFQDYLKWGGLPGRFIYNEEEEIERYLQSVYDSVVLRDIVYRSKLRDLDLLDDIIQFMLDNIGHIFSGNKIINYIKSNSRKISPETLYNYIKVIVNSLVMQKVNRYDIRGKNVFSTLEKYYIADLGLLQLKHSKIEENLTGRLENLVANQLTAKGWNINVGVLPKAEVDFVAEKSGERRYVQVAYVLDSQKAVDREFGAFKAIDDNYPKYVITTDKIKQSQSGIKHLNIIDWLLSDKF
ncbi:MAG: ATP-binding protein [Candidatus Ancillula sp.]|nr:ATP-binding protein [Candidatus Ancillula sp.]